MERKINKLANCHVEVVVNVDKDRKGPEKLNTLVKRCIPGFPRQSPMHLIKGHVDQSRVLTMQSMVC